MRIAITGATGFIGRHVMALLSQRADIEMVVLSRRPLDNANWTWVECDITKPDADLWEKCGCPDTLLHLAWSGLPNYRSLHHLETEAPAHFRFLKNLADRGLRRAVIAGTCFEYGMVNGELAESAVASPANPYGLAKHVLHQQLEVAVPALSLCWARLFYMFGEGQSATSLYPMVKSACHRNDMEFPMSGGEQLRDYLPVKDVARLLVGLVLNADVIGTINVCSGRPRSIRGLVEQWMEEEAWQPKLALGRYPYPDWEPFAFWGARRKLDAILAQTS